MKMKKKMKKKSGCAASTQPDVPSPGKIKGNDQLREAILTRDNAAEEANIVPEMLGQSLLRKPLHSYPMHNLPLLLLLCCHRLAKGEPPVFFRHHPMDVTAALQWCRCGVGVTEEKGRDDVYLHPVC
ncbi:uncharacterized protein MONOS_8060 [Monocercomonoides exilis]|uniref:uncharacterized protein n=1 Tax=Monocercomonoides exilis TaxID=2049356 RepID=UPI003559764F|nr:hypothetical protein MONOS_8060 [Monocercomonoides exilis]|eukprot:MONOS_8060.1-p1 / transcript=MONOS_8060.1 / gene=MONOS_8060 / organism=Monocercomonoides_exilis_PA203 / gene_product=unspecified product / transcript_product=unspecified product / location=Mono_scaffold00293:56410-57310(-) / protein_length=127 / sequence_SO=supercontig / SO=protein_coding / is_pseudo=false